MYYNTKEFDLKKFNFKFDKYNENKIKNIYQDELNSLDKLKYIKKKFNPLDYNLKKHFDLFIYSGIYILNEKSLINILKNEFIQFYLSILFIIPYLLILIFNFFNISSYI